MSLIPLGFWAASGGGAAGAYDLLETQVLASSAASVTFTGLDTLAAGYQHLQIRMVTRYDNATTATVNAKLVLDSDTGANYSNHRLQGDGSSVSSTYFAGAAYLDIRDFVVGNNATANAFGAAIVDILDFSSTSKNSTMRALSGSPETNESKITLSSGAWLDTAAITTIQISPSSANWLTGSRFSLYGVK